jgi:hypothetical protein
MAKKRPQRNSVIWAEGQPRRDPNADEHKLRQTVSDSPQAMEGMLNWLKARLELEPGPLLLAGENDGPTGLIAEWANTAMPTATGLTGLTHILPYFDGVSMTFRMTRFSLRRETAPSSGTYTAQPEWSAGGGAFSGTGFGSASVTSATAEDEDVALDETILVSGDLLRVNFTAIGSGGGMWTAKLEAVRVT